LIGIVWSINDSYHIAQIGVKPSNVPSTIIILGLLLLPVSILLKWWNEYKNRKEIKYWKEKLKIKDSDLISEEEEKETEMDGAIMFSEVIGYEAFIEELGEDWHNTLLIQLNQIMVAEVKKYGGIVVKAMGNEIFCYFHTADASIKAAIEIQTKISGVTILGSNVLQARIGLGYGKLNVKSGDVWGDPVNTAAQMFNVATPGQIVASIQLKGNSSEKWQALARNFPYIHNGVEGGFAVCEICWQSYKEVELITKK
jgi:class 3 adenylate cyclase